MELKGFYIGIEILCEKSILRILLDLQLKNSMQNGYNDHCCQWKVLNYLRL